MTDRRGIININCDFLVITVSVIYYSLGDIFIPTGGERMADRSVPGPRLIEKQKRREQSSNLKALQVARIEFYGD